MGLITLKAIAPTTALMIEVVQVLWLMYFQVLTIPDEYREKHAIEGFE